MSYQGFLAQRPERVQFKAAMPISLPVVAPSAFRSADDEWRMANDEWRMADDEWRMADDEWRMANDEWRMANDKWRMGDDKCRDETGRPRFPGARKCVAPSAPAPCALGDDRGPDGGETP